MTLRDSHEIVRGLAAGEKGQTMAEYGVVMAVIVTVAIGIAGLAALFAGRLEDLASFIG